MRGWGAGFGVRVKAIRTSGWGFCFRVEDVAGRLLYLEPSMLGLPSSPQSYLHCNDEHKGGPQQMAQGGPVM